MAKDFKKFKLTKFCQIWSHKQAVLGTIRHRTLVLLKFLLIKNNDSANVKSAIRIGPNMILNKQRNHMLCCSLITKVLLTNYRLAKIQRKYGTIAPNILKCIPSPIYLSLICSIRVYQVEKLSIKKLLIFKTHLSYRIIV